LGEIERNVVINAARRGGRLPPAVANPPRLLPGLEMYLDAFWSLNTCRTVDGGPIPWTAIETWLDRARIFALNERHSAHYILRSMDNEYLKWLAAEARRQTQRGSSQNVHPAQRGRRN
jgi:hypothetical protein